MKTITFMDYVEVKQENRWLQHKFKCMKAEAAAFKDERDELLKKLEVERTALKVRRDMHEECRTYNDGLVKERDALLKANEDHQRQVEMFRDKAMEAAQDYSRLADFLRDREAMPEGCLITEAVKDYIKRLENDVAFNAQVIDMMSTPGRREKKIHQHIAVKMYPILKGYKLRCRSDVPGWDDREQGDTVDLPGGEPKPVEDQVSYVDWVLEKGTTR